MAKLSSLKPLLSSAPLRVGQAPKTEQERSKFRDATQSWRAWYKLKRWTDLRLRVFIRDRFTCQRKGCGKVDGNTSRLRADHIKPHRGDPVLFWDEANVQTLCQPCHDSVKQSEERQGIWD